MVISKQGKKYILKSHSTGRKLGSFSSKKKAEKRERQINYFKHMGGGK